MSARALNADLQNLLQNLAAFGQTRGRPPLVKEVLADELAARCSPETTTRWRLARLEDEGLVRVEGSGHGKMVQLTENGHFALRTGTLSQPMPYFSSGLHAGPREIECDGGCNYINSLADLLPIDDAAMTYFAPIVGECMDVGPDGVTRDAKRPAPEGADVMLRRCGRFTRPRNGQAAHVEVAIRDTGETAALLRDYYFDESECMVTLVPRNPAFPITCHRDEDVDPRGVLVTIIVNDDGEPSPGALDALNGARRGAAPISLGITDSVANVFGRDAHNNQLAEAAR